MQETLLVQIILLSFQIPSALHKTNLFQLKLDGTLVMQKLDYVCSYHGDLA